ncbi:spondin domain-containing protein [Hoylesella pleuritidis]|uniref:spondin domain-containing protein n=1 Tax=Hoylesella pleuritidis TaxID=407975 RepID=UPI00235785CA|nr:spondin domain-containing protein [Hoylesella pleuritidis]
MKKNRFRAALSAVVLAGLVFTSCSKDDDMKPSTGSMRTLTVENIVTPKLFVESGSFKNMGESPIIQPGQSVSFKFKAGKGQALMFTTMYGKSKDWFFASQQPGIKLFNAQGKAMTGDVSSQVKLWDNGTKNDKTGASESNPIMEVKGVDASKLLNVMLSYEEPTSEFTLTIKNTSAGTGNETPFSPGIWAVSTFDGNKLLAEKPFFTPGEKSNPEMTDIAQMGKIDKLKMKVEANTGIITGISPVLVVVYQGEKNPIYELGKNDPGMGLKDLAQKGNASKLQESLKKMKGVKGIYIAGTAPVGPGQKVMTQYKAGDGDKLAFVTMFGFSNDWFYANEQVLSAKLSGDITNKTALFDSGTGVDQYPGAGNRQALFGGTPQAENKPISKVGTTFPVPPVNKVLKITIQ